MRRFKPLTRCEPMEPNVLRWVCRVASQNLWRVNKLLAYEDLVQEGHLCYQLVCRKYGQLEPAHRMALFKTTFNNKLINLSNKQTAQAPVLNAADDSVLDSIAAPAARAEEATLDDVRAEAPPPVAKLISAITRPNGKGRVVRPNIIALLQAELRLYADGSRQTLNERLCRLAKLDPKRVDVATMTRDYLQQRLSA